MRVFRPALLSATALCGLAHSAPASAQRAGENVVASAEDAFGTSVGNERIGIYSPFGARGFSPVQAGNVRIEGMFFDYQADLNERVTAGSTVRVGLTAQGYPFPAPTGVGDFFLRKPGNEAVLSTLVGYGPYDGARIEMDGQLPLTSDLSVGGGLSYNQEENFYGEGRDLSSGALLARWRPSDSIEVIPFWSISDSSGGEAQPIIFTAGNAFLPPQLERRRYFGAEWAQNEFRNINYGAVATVGMGDWTLRSGLFRSLVESDRAFTNLFLNTDQEGNADRVIVAEANRRFGSVSGEVRLSRRLTEGDRLHQFHLAVRGREQRRLYGGGQLIDAGPGRIDEPIDVPEPVFNFGPQSRDAVSQYTVGLGYEGRWRDVGELTLGVQRSQYKKEVTLPTETLPVSEASPWLFNAALSIYASPAIAFYAGYTKGLEESPIAPEIARNRDEAPPALLTRQMDAGVRIRLSENLRLVAGVFDVEKPYYALDNTLLFTNLGTVRHRGAEFSLAGQITPRLSLVAGTVLLDATVSGEAVDQGLVGEKPVGSIARTSSAGLNYQLPWFEALSLDLGYESTSSRIANSQNTLRIPPRYIYTLGARYRFDIADKPATLRALWATVNNVYGYNSYGEGFYYNLPRRFSLSLVVDI